MASPATTVEVEVNILDNGTVNVTVAGEKTTNVGWDGSGFSGAFFDSFTETPPEFCYPEMTISGLLSSQTTMDITVDVGISGSTTFEITLSDNGCFN